MDEENKANAQKANKPLTFASKIKKFSNLINGGDIIQNRVFYQTIYFKLLGINYSR